MPDFCCLIRSGRGIKNKCGGGGKRNCGGGGGGSVSDEYHG